jgi:UDP-4-amino-4,6-dideoxy-N-acetyl-beta-L-altrosamine N-acetyltransferase
MYMTDTCLIRKITEQDLPMVLAWRNHANVRRYMFRQHEISLEEHQNWFSNASRDPSRSLLIVEDAGLAIGYVQFQKIEEGGVADWGFYAKPDSPKGKGRKIGKMALNYAFGPLKLHKVCGQAIACNQASIAFHRFLGFNLEGILRDQRRINGAYHSLYCFGLLDTEWHSHKLEQK